MSRIYWCHPTEILDAMLDITDVGVAVRAEGSLRMYCIRESAWCARIIGPLARDALRIDASRTEHGYSIAHFDLSCPR